MNYKNAGMTLIEVLASVTLLSIVILTFSYVFIQSQAVTSSNGERLTALQNAQQVLSTKLTNGTLPVPSDSDPEDPSDPPDGEGWELANFIKEPLTYVYENNHESLPMILVRTYYGDNNQFVELYNYKQNDASNQ